METTEKLDNQNGMMPGSGTVRKLGLNSEFDVWRALETVSLSYLLFVCEKYHNIFIKTDE